MNNKSILLIGRPDSGKTTFLGQFHARIDSNKSVFKLYKSIENLTPIIEASVNLSKGDEVKTTPSDKSTTMSFPLTYNNLLIDLDCPDYGGEQINQILESRELSLKWVDSIEKSNNWILFIRPTDLVSYYDLSNKTINPEVLENESKKLSKYSISDQSFFIELLQIFLSAKGQDAHFKNDSLNLTIALTCWDELGNTSSPEKELVKRLPLLQNFIESNWVPSRYKILGLSSLGFSLKDPVNKQKYKQIGSENFGFLIKSDGSQEQDITQLILESL